MMPMGRQASSWGWMNPARMKDKATKARERDDGASQLSSATCWEIVRVKPSYLLALVGLYCTWMRIPIKTAIMTKA